jgi:hypothetical protein
MLSLALITRTIAARWLAVVLAAGLLSACAVKLAPDYDKIIVNGLSSLNEEMMIFFASVSGGTQARTFGEREQSYNAIIGKLDALKIQAEARPVPRPYVFQILGVGQNAKNPDEVEELEAPTGDIIAVMSETMTKMRDTDKKQGVRALEVQAFKGNIAISMDQALTYEKALER